MAMRVRRFMSSVRRGRPGRIFSPARSAATQTRVSCARPATGIVQISHSIWAPPNSPCPKVRPDTIRMFSRTGAAAAAAKRPTAFSAPDRSAASEIVRM